VSVLKYVDVCGSRLANPVRRSLASDRSLSSPYRNPPSVLEEFSELYYNDEVTCMSVLTFIVNNTPQEDLPTTAAQTAQYLKTPDSNSIASCCRRLAQE